MHKHSLKHPKSITYPVHIKVLLGLEDGLIGQRPSMQQAQERQQKHYNNTLHPDCLWSKWSSEEPQLSLSSTGHRPAGHVCKTTPKTSPTKQTEQSSPYLPIDSCLCLMFLFALDETNRRFNIHMILFNIPIIFP